MKKSIFLTMAVFAITLFSSQFASGQWVVCNEDAERDRDIYVSAPYFSVDLIAEIGTLDGYAYADVIWMDRSSRYHVTSQYCPGRCGFRNIGTQNGGGIPANIYCYSSGWKSYAKSELWQW